MARPLNSRHATQLEFLRAWSRLLDNQFVVPGTRMRFGIDPIIGLVPFLGDIATPLFGAVIIVHAFRMRIPKVVQGRMLVNVIIDVVTGAVPVVGDLFDFVWKSNAMNLRLLEDHAFEAKQPTTADWLFVLGALAILAACVIVPLAVLVWFIHAVESLRLL